MKKTIKSVMAMALALVLTASSLGGTALAASSESGSIDGCSWSARVTKTTRSATATTKITGATNAYVDAAVEVYYWLGRVHYYTPASDSQTNGYAVATASKQLGGAEVEGGMGEHTIFYHNTTKSCATFIGDIPSNPTRA